MPGQRRPSDPLQQGSLPTYLEDPATVQAAMRTVAANARDADDCRLILTALGLIGADDDSVR